MVIEVIGYGVILLKKFVNYIVINYYIMEKTVDNFCENIKNKLDTCLKEQLNDVNHIMKKDECTKLSEQVTIVCEKKK
tara:strand:- start:108 stop:341 length:234 start_codon:yes stop_codon:yes gene_type:complete